MLCVVETSCANAYIVEDLTASDEYKTLIWSLRHSEEKKNVRPTEREKESIIIFAMLNVQINIFFIFACIHVSTMRCENCTVRLSLHKMNHWFPCGISPARWQRMDMDAKLLLQTGWAIVTVSTLFKMHTHNQTLHVQKMYSCAFGSNTRSLCHG